MARTKYMLNELEDTNCTFKWICIIRNKFRKNKRTRTYTTLAATDWENLRKGQPVTCDTKKLKEFTGT